MLVEEFDVAVIGGGHAGIEAALAAARMGAKTVMFLLNADTIGQMSCNPAIGGIAKGIVVREIDALGGEMGRAIDHTGIQFKMLNTRKGKAVWSPRAQADKKLYREYMKRACENQENLYIKQDEVGGENYEEVLYEGYAPNGVALMILTYTDNRNRTTSEIRHILSKHGGNLGSSGCVSFLFDRVGIIEVPKEGVSKGYSGKGDRCPWGGDGKSHRPYGHTVQNAKHKKGQGRMVSQSPGG